MNKFKQYIKYLIIIFIDFFIEKNPKIKDKTILVVRLDSIGDYILFRNYLEVLNNEYKGYKITLVGNNAWKSISHEFDDQFIEEFIWVDVDKFRKNLYYKLIILKKINKIGYEKIINPTYSRDYFIDDNIVRIINAKEKIGSVGNFSNISKWQKKLSDKYYTKLIPAKKEVLFEFYRNKEFVESLLDTKLSIKKPMIILKEKIIDYSLPNEYAILFIGASASYRKWSIENFVEIGKYIQEIYGYSIVVCGGPADLEDSKRFEELADYKYINMVGKTSLIDFLYIIDNGKLMVSNETSAPHFAVALDMKNIFVIYNGNHYGRFTPYPKEINSNYYVIFHPEIIKDLDNYKKLSNSYNYENKLDINDIKVDIVKNILKEKIH